MSCEECAELTTHTFRSANDLLHAVRLAAEEVDRGVLSRVNAPPLRDSEQEALHSSLTSGALPGTVSYRFRCEICGDEFTLHADTSTGEGGWTREGHEP